MKTAISLPDEVFNQAERLARRKHMSRSELYTNAIRRYVQQEYDSGITEQLNIVYKANPDFDKIVECAGISDLPKEVW